MSKVTLTFDNGPDPQITPAVLATLRRHGVLTTFFVLGDKLRDRRNLAEQAHAEGHWIGNHTFNHLVPLGLSGERGTAVDEIDRTQELIGELSHPRRFFRPFGGGGVVSRDLLNEESIEYLTKNRFTCVLWNAVPQDWIYPASWVERALNLCDRQEETCLVLHDIATGAMSSLDRFIGCLLERGTTITQDFPASCIAMDQGQPRDALKAARA